MERGWWELWVARRKRSTHCDLSCFWTARLPSLDGSLLPSSPSALSSLLPPDSPTQPLQTCADSLRAKRSSCRVLRSLTRAEREAGC